MNCYFSERYMCVVDSYKEVSHGAQPHFYHASSRSSCNTPKQESVPGRESMGLKRKKKKNLFMKDVDYNLDP